MGSFGSKKKVSNDNAKALAALQSPDFYTPFGSLSGNVYTAIESADSVSARNEADQKINALIQNLPTDYSGNDLLNNPYYQTSLSLYQTPINQQKQHDLTSLNNQLSARNQFGSSYEAYQQNLLNKRYDNLYSQADKNAQVSSMNAYNTQISNLLNTLGALRSEKNASLSAAMMPLNSALNYQQTQAPYRTAQANYWLQQGNNDNSPSAGNIFSGAIRGAAMGTSIGGAGGGIAGGVIGGLGGLFSS